jgi:hypothetical protein
LIDRSGRSPLIRSRIISLFAVIVKRGIGCELEPQSAHSGRIGFFLLLGLATNWKDATISRLMKEFWLATLIWAGMGLALMWAILLAVKGSFFPLVLVSGAFVFGIGKIGCASH